MTPGDWISLAVGILALILIPMLGLTIRGVVKWTRIEDKLGVIAEDFKDMAAREDRIHADLFNQMRDDRMATNQRLRWLEEFLWRPRSLPSCYLAVMGP